MVSWPPMFERPLANTDKEERSMPFKSEERSMPFKSEAQRRYFEANKAKLEKQGVDVKEWEQSSKG